MISYSCTKGEHDRCTQGVTAQVHHTAGRHAEPCACPCHTQDPGDT